MPKAYVARCSDAPEVCVVTLPQDDGSNTLELVGKLALRFLVTEAIDNGDQYELLIDVDDHEDFRLIKREIASYCDVENITKKEGAVA